jgi:hypothetical protein
MVGDTTQEAEIFPSSYKRISRVWDGESSAGGVLELKCSE